MSEKEDCCDVDETTVLKGRDSSTLLRDGEDSFEEKYERHDVGEAYVHGVLQEAGLDVRAWGLDARGKDGELVEDSRMDMKVYDGDRLVALIDVKTKGRPHWMGAMNKRHYDDYIVHRHAYGVPTFVVFTLLNDDDSLVDDVQVVPVEECTFEEDGYFPDGNRRVTAVETTEGYGWEVFQARVGGMHVQ